MGRSENDSFDDVPLSALLRSARATYAEAVDRAHARAGLDDLPVTGAFVIGAMHGSGASLEAVIHWMGVSKQAVGQSVDALVDRGYLERTRDPVDRRRVRLTLTDRGRGAGAAGRRAIERVDRDLLARVGARNVAAARATLAALIQMGRLGPPGAPRSERSC